MAASVLTDPFVEPTMEEAHQAAGTAAPIWDALVAFAIDDCGAKGGFVHWGKEYGWALQFVRAGRPFFTLYPAGGTVTLQVVLGRADRASADSLPLADRIRREIDQARSYPDGTWVYLHLSSLEDVPDVRRLIGLKLPPRVRARVEAAAPVA